MKEGDNFINFLVASQGYHHLCLAISLKSTVVNWPTYYQEMLLVYPWSAGSLLLYKTSLQTKQVIQFSHLPEEIKYISIRLIDFKFFYFYFIKSRLSLIKFLICYSRFLWIYPIRYFSYLFRPYRYIIYLFVTYIEPMKQLYRKTTFMI